MGKIYDNVIQLIGNTPILHLHKMEEEEGLEANIYAKVEGFNPGGSVKDRAALNMIEAAEKEGKLKPHLYPLSKTTMPQSACRKERVRKRSRF